jgi:hypothetical protein
VLSSGRGGTRLQERTQYFFLIAHTHTAPHA